MTTKKLPGGNILPHNPLKTAGLLDEVKRLKGDKTWLQFDCECIMAKHPSNLVVKRVLDKIAGKAKTKQSEVSHE